MLIYQLIMYVIRTVLPIIFCLHVSQKYKRIHALNICLDKLICKKCR